MSTYLSSRVWSDASSLEGWRPVSFQDAFVIGQSKVPLGKASVVPLTRPQEMWTDISCSAAPNWDAYVGSNWAPLSDLAPHSALNESTPIAPPYPLKALNSPSDDAKFTKSPLESQKAKGNPTDLLHSVPLEAPYTPKTKRASPPPTGSPSSLTPPPLPFDLSPPSKYPFYSPFPYPDPDLSPTLDSDISRQNLYKTELCRSWVESATCKYGSKCQFAHGHAELRPVVRHPKYKTEICKTFHTNGTCPYGKRCRFVHNPMELRVSAYPTEEKVATPASGEASPCGTEEMDFVGPVVPGGVGAVGEVMPKKNGSRLPFFQKLRKQIA